MSDILFAPAHERATCSCHRQVSVMEVLEVPLVQIARYHPPLNPIVTLDEE